MRKSNYDSEQQNSFLKELAEHFDANVVTSRQINEFIKLKGKPYPHFLFNPKAGYSVSWGKYRVRGSAVTPKASEPANLAAMVSNVSPIQASNGNVHSAVVVALHRKVAADTGESFLVEKDPTYVPFGFYNDLKLIIQAKIFYPVYITGLSGNGKTKMVEQVVASCRDEGRELIRVNITKETDETDLLGGHDLIDGNTVRRDGPVTIAMKRGAVLLLDETDYGSERLLCLQPILEGKPFFDKKSGAVVHPAAGFNIIATANTKGKGSDDGRFIGANVLNEAFLERFAITVEQEYPNESTEKRILLRNFETLNIKDEAFADSLVKWAAMIRKTFASGATDEIVSTRRLVHIAKAYSLFNNRMKAIELCLNRFDNETKQSFMDAYTKVDASANKPQPTVPDIFEDGSEDTTERLKKTVQQTVMPPAVQPAAPRSVAPAGQGRSVNPFSNVVAGASPAATTKMPAWASPAHLMKVTMTMKEPGPVEITRGTNGWNVKAYGFTTYVNDIGCANTMSPDGVLKAVVDICYQGKMTGSAPNPFV